MNISDEAINAAFEAYYANINQGGPSACSAAISAIAPLLMAQAWDEGVSDGQWNAEHVYQIQAGSRHAIENPHRSQS